LRGDDLLLAHLAILFPDEEPVEHEEAPSARERLVAEVGEELAERLLSAT
jgi:hypothetical protein